MKQDSIAAARNSHIRIFVAPVILCVLVKQKMQKNHEWCGRLLAKSFTSRATLTTCPENPLCPPLRRYTRMMAQVLTTSIFFTCVRP